MSWGAARSTPAVVRTAEVVTAVVVGVLVVPRPLVVVALAASATLVAVLRRLDAWQRLYAVTLVLMLGATSSLPTVAQLSFYPRYLAAAALLVVTFRSPRARLRDLPAPRRRLVAGLYAIVVLAGFSTLWSYDPVTTAQQAVALALLAALVHGLLVGRWAHPDSVGADLRVAYVVLVGACAASLAAALVGLPEAHAYSGRLQGVLSNPNMLAMAAALAVALAWGVYRDTRRLRYLVPVVVPLAALLESGSRTALVAVLLAAGWTVLRHLTVPRHVVPALAAGAAAAAVLLLAPGLATHNPAVARMLEGDGEDPLNTRGAAWTGALELWRDRPVGGWGFQAGPALFRDQNGVAGFEFTREAVHNGYLQTLLELGVLGAVVLVVLVAGALAATLRVPWHGIATGLGAVVVAGAAVQLTESATFGTGQVFPWVFWLAVAGTVALGARASDEVAGPAAASSARSGPGAVGRVAARG